ARQATWLRGRALAGVERPAGFAHQRNRGIGAAGVGRMAAAAGPEAFALGGFGDRVERYLCPARPAAGAGRAAVDPRRPDRIDERPVEAAISRQHRLPALRGTHGGNLARAPTAFYPFCALKSSLPRLVLGRSINRGDLAARHA